MNRVKQAGARSRRETSDIGSADDSQLDPMDVLRGLAHMDILRVRVAAASANRRRGRAAPPRSAAEAHAIEHGHLLTFGCCRAA
jgi:hypothetical protein